MKVLVVHEFYQQPGGEDEVVDRESRLLESHGHEIIRYFRHNNEIRDRSIGERIDLLKSLFWSRRATAELAALIRARSPDIVHFHNTFPLISPSAYYACRRYGVPVVQSLHNPRLMCPSANFFRDGKTCLNCLGKTVAWSGILHGCYRESRSTTAAVAGMVAFHRALGTWRRLVDRYVVFTRFYERLFIEAGLPASRITVKPHFVSPDPGPRSPGREGEYALFIGRLDREKGVGTLLDAWRSLEGVPLKVRGDGDLVDQVEAFVRSRPRARVGLVGRLDEPGLFELIKGARFLVWPSQGFYETFGLVAIEAFACGIPVITTGAGVMAENVEDGVTGLHFEPGDADDLRRKVHWAWSHPREIGEMGRNARQAFERTYSKEVGYRNLMRVYEEVRRVYPAGRAGPRGSIRG